jgi:hypothetical protein
MLSNHNHLGAVLYLVAALSSAASAAQALAAKDATAGAADPQDRPGLCLLAPTFISAPHGSHRPLLEGGYGLMGQFFYWPGRRGAVGVEVGFGIVDFDLDAFREQDRLEPTNTCVLLNGAVLARFVPFDLAGVRLFVDAGLGGVEWQEHYRYYYNDLEPGPWFPSGTYTDIDETRTRSAIGPTGGLGFQWEGNKGVGFFAGASELVVNSNHLSAHWTRLQMGVTFRLDLPRSR